jgi:hypothetical protein
VIAARCGLVGGRLRRIRGIRPRPDLLYIVMKRPPHPGVIHLNHLGDRADRPGSHHGHGHDQRLEQQHEAATFACSRNADLPDPALDTADARHPGRQPCLVLEAVEMAPCHLFGVVSRAVRGSAAWAGETAARGKSR